MRKTNKGGNVAWLHHSIRNGNDADCSDNVLHPNLQGYFFSERGQAKALGHRSSREGLSLVRRITPCDQRPRKKRISIRLPLAIQPYLSFSSSSKKWPLQLAAVFENSFVFCFFFCFTELWADSDILAALLHKVISCFWCGKASDQSMHWSRVNLSTDWNWWAFHRSVCLMPETGLCCHRLWLSSSHSLRSLSLLNNCLWTVSVHYVLWLLCCPYRPCDFHLTGWSLEWTGRLLTILDQAR